MKKTALLFLGVSLICMAESRTAYIMVDKDLDLSEVKVSGIIKESGSSEKKFTESGITSAGLGEKITITLDEATEYKAYGDTRYIKLEIDEVENTDGVKFVLGYPVSGKDIPTYVVIASQNIKDADINGDSLEELFQKETRDMENLVSAGDYDYDSFPGRELQKDTRISGVVIGEQPMDDSILPSNIVDLYSKEGGELDDTVNKVTGGAEINPNNSNTNSEFELWAVKTDVDGNVVYKEPLVPRLNQDGNEAKDENGNTVYEAERVLLYTSKDSGDENPLYFDLRSVVPVKKNDNYKDGDVPVETGSSLYMGDPSDEDPYKHFVFDIDVRFKGSGTININNKPVDVGLGDKKWQFYNVADVNLTFNGGNSFYFGLKGDEVGIVPPDGSNPGDIPLPLSEEFYAIEDSGDFKEGEAEIISTYENTTRRRKTNIIMKVMTETGSTERNYEIENIDE